MSTTRRVFLRGSSTDLVYELQIINASSAFSPLDIHHHLEEIVHTWRTAARWTIVVAHDPDGKRFCANVVVRRHTATARLDNAYLGWQRQLKSLLSNNAVPLRRTWTEVNGSRAKVYANVRIAAEPFSETCITAKALARSFAGQRGTVSVSSDWTPLPPMDLTSSRA